MTRNNKLKRGLAAAGAAVVMALSVAPAHAELPAEIATTTTEAKADVKEAGGMILGVIVVIAGIAWLRRVIR